MHFGTFVRLPREFLASEEALHEEMRRDLITRFPAVGYGTDVGWVVDQSGDLHLGPARSGDQRVAIRHVQHGDVVRAVLLGLVARAQQPRLVTLAPAAIGIRRNVADYLVAFGRGVLDGRDELLGPKISKFFPFAPWVMLE